jgi:hypothetical protein
MSRFLKVFLRDPLNARIQVAGFGKHPAWDDHIDDIGLNTETLVLAKQILYSGGIAAQLGSGAWDQIEKASNAIEFDHRFIWGRKQQAIFGAIWASADRKGRTRFPLVVCGHSGFEGPRALDLLFDPIERLGALCRAARTQDEVREAFGKTQGELNYGIPTPIEGICPSEITDSEEKTILSALVTLSAGLKYKRTRTQLEGAKSSGTHYRLAPVFSQAKDNLRFWSAYLAAQSSVSNSSYLVIAANGKSWVDLIVGEPLANNFFCLKANEIALPATWVKVEAPQLPKLELEAANYLRSYRLGTACSATSSRSWWTNLFRK